MQEDYCSKTGATNLALRIKQYWKDKGKDISLWIEPFHTIKTSNHIMFTIRSNLRNGLPK